ncbi:hypothetical protein C8C78_101120 [Halanaerobium congolense]|jgi:hypothetical protein|uniref:Uncharacterized protein n=1 Tax=Halanaerobium congolense TaxID=54121 RepID=A0A318EC85_9FIRM|nr:hypothetical protein [Halanaerobium congolense]PXV70123.1 hypothetical protein C8C78_101120 [Halanaerobium congolense]
MSLEEIIQFINNNSGVIALFFSGVVAISTVVYSVLTSKLVSETIKMREVETEPDISVIVQPRKEFINFIDLIIENIGNGPAYNISFEVSKDFIIPSDEKLSELPIMKKIEYMAPSQKIQFFLASMIDDKDNPKKFTITANYENKNGKEYTSEYIVDFNKFKGLTQLGKPDSYKIANNIEKIRKDFHNLYTGFKRLKIETYNKEDRKEEQRIKEERRQKQKEKIEN